MKDAMFLFAFGRNTDIDSNSCVSYSLLDYKSGSVTTIPKLFLAMSFVVLHD